MLSDDTSEQRLEQLETALARLDARLARAEVVLRLAPGPPAEPTVVATATESVSPVATYFARLAVICFALVGALLLRTLAQQTWIDPHTGVALGLAYCAGLLLAPAWSARLRTLAPHAWLLQHCAAVLASLIMLESCARQHVIGVALASVIALLTMLATVASSVRQNRVSLAAIGLLFPFFAIVAIGRDLTDAPWRAAAAGAIAIAALVLATRARWSIVRPLVVLPVGLALGLALVATGRRGGISPAVPLALLASGLALWLAIAAWHLYERERLSWSAQFWLPFASVWTVLLGLQYRPALAAAIALFVGAGLLAVAFWLGGRPAGAGGGAGCCALAGALVFGAGAAVVDPTGVSLAILAGAITLLARRMASRWLLGGAGLATLGALAAAALHRQLEAMPVLGPSALAANGVLATALVLQCITAWRPPRLHLGSAVVGVRSLALGSALVAMFCLARQLAASVFGTADDFVLVETLLILTFLIGALLVARASQSRTWSGVGLVAMVVLAAKVALIDLFQLDGARVMTSVVALGLASVLLSLTLRRRVR